MRAAGITALGEPVEIFEVDELATPAASEVLIDVVAAGIGNWDELVRIGSWQIGGPAPMALGTEAAGTVAAAGLGVAGLREGDEVMTHPLPLRQRDRGRRRLRLRRPPARRPRGAEAEQRPERDPVRAGGGHDAERGRDVRRLAADVAACLHRAVPGAARQPSSG